jgi:Zn-dependent protease/CBS domain-containing protein
MAQGGAAVFGRSITLFKIFGFAIRIDPSWFIVVVLFTWTFSAQLFPQMVPGLSRTTYLGMGIAAVLGLFLSVILHELSHALTARRFGIEMRGITLFIFGGVAEMTNEPPHPKAELWIAAAGPIASFAIALAAFGLTVLATTAGLAVPVVRVLGFLAYINVTLAVFNLIPAFPLDGGRILRSILWKWKGSLRRATRTTSQIGSGFGMLLLALGVLRFVFGDFLGGMWMFLIGLFVRNAAQMSYQQLLLRRAFEGEPVSRFMQTNPVTVPRHISVAELVQSYIYRYHFKMFPVVDDAGRLIGCVNTRQVKELPREEWDRQTVGALASQCGPENTVRADTDAMAALSAMSRAGISRLMVVDGDRLLGILALKDLLRFFSLKMELEEGGTSPQPLSRIS